MDAAVFVQPECPGLGELGGVPTQADGASFWLVALAMLTQASGKATTFGKRHAEKPGIASKAVFTGNQPASITTDLSMAASFLRIGMLRNPAA